MAAKPVRTILTVLMDLLVVMAVAQVLLMIVEFFGQLAAQPWATSFIALTSAFTIRFGIESIKTPYGGVFDVNAALTVIVFLLLEWVLSVARSRA